MSKRGRCTSELKPVGKARTGRLGRVGFRASFRVTSYSSSLMSRGLVSVDFWGRCVVVRGCGGGLEGVVDGSSSKYLSFTIE